MLQPRENSVTSDTLNIQLVHKPGIGSHAQWVTVFFVINRRPVDRITIVILFILLVERFLSPASMNTRFPYISQAFSPLFFWCILEHVIFGYKSNWHARPLKTTDANAIPGLFGSMNITRFHRF